MTLTMSIIHLKACSATRMSSRFEDVQEQGTSLQGITGWWDLLM